MNYKKILFYYLNTVGEEEGITFVRSIGYRDELTEEEKDELRRLDGLTYEQFEKELSDEF